MSAMTRLLGFLLVPLLVAVSHAAPAMDISVAPHMRLSAGYLSLNHDASALTPPTGSWMPSYGDPTSILSYEPLYRADIELVMSGRGDARWFDLVLALPVAGGGTFADRDYRAGPVLFSETFSEIGLGHGGSAQLRVGLPSEPTQWNGMAVRPYGTARMGLERYAANGLRCGAVCPTGTLGSQYTAIGQDIFSASAGLGVWLEREIAPGRAFDFRLELSGGYLGVSDSHYLRPDLGAVPNIAYDFATFDAMAEAGYRHEIGEGTTLSASIFAGGQLGLGRTVFGNAAGSQAALPAWTVSGSAGARLGASIAF